MRLGVWVSVWCVSAPYADMHLIACRSALACRTLVRASVNPLARIMLPMQAANAYTAKECIGRKSLLGRND